MSASVPSWTGSAPRIDVTGSRGPSRVRRASAMVIAALISAGVVLAAVQIWVLNPLAA